MPNRYSYEPEAILAAAQTAKTKSEVAGAIGAPAHNFRSWLIGQPDLRAKVERLIAKNRITKLEVIEGGADTEHHVQARKVLKKGATLHELADHLDLSPSRTKQILGDLKAEGYRVNPDAEHIAFEKPVPSSHITTGLFDGETIRFGVVSDTHLGDRDCALDHLHVAYDVFKDEGIETVLHAGDIVTGRGIFRHQDAELTHFTFQDQVAHAVEDYPRRDGIKTVLVGGNHDLEGDFGRMGADPCQAIAHQRDDIDYLGAYEGWIETPGGGYIHLLHGGGGMSYAVSYKAQKIVESYEAGRKPSILIMGHFHVRGVFAARNVEVMFPGCFQWRTALGIRKGLTPSVGFHICEATFGDDGSLVKWRPDWYPFYEGRVVAGAALG